MCIYDQFRTCTKLKQLTVTVYLVASIRHGTMSLQHLFHGEIEIFAWWGLHVWLNIKDNTLLDDQARQANSFLTTCTGKKTNIKFVIVQNAESISESERFKIS